MLHSNNSSPWFPQGELSVSAVETISSLRRNSQLPLSLLLGNRLITKGLIRIYAIFGLVFMPNLAGYECFMKA